ncbi:MAG: nitrogen-specific signal transduction histidine kinase/CheY-like chemotaxis protein [Enterobacterales bacterium]|jgi:nitrogen-specific signal transduction histidine kinase/CheY-like chemotaxis protein
MQFKANYEEKRLATIWGLVLTVLILFSGGYVYQQMEKQSETFLNQGLESLLQNKVQLFVNRLTGANGINHPDILMLRYPLVATLKNSDNKSILSSNEILQSIAEQYMENNFLATSFYDRNGNQVAQAGEFSENGMVSFNIESLDNMVLVWNGQFILRVTNAIFLNKVYLGKVVSEKSQPELTETFLNFSAIGVTGEFAICQSLQSDDFNMQCVLNGFEGYKSSLQRPKTINGQSLPMSHALDGNRGLVYTKDYRDEDVVAAYSPVDNLGLGFVFKIDQDDLYAPLINNINFIIPVLIAFVIFGTLLLHWLVAPLIRNIIYSQNEAILSNSKLNKQKNLYQSMFENADISIWNEDMSDLKSTLDQLRFKGVTDLYQYLIEHPQKVLEFAAMIKVLNVNNATLEMFNVSSEAEFLEQIPSSFGPDAEEVFTKELCAIWDGEKIFRSEATFTTHAGNHIDAIISFYIPVSEEGFKSVTVSIVDITLQKQTEEELLKSRKLESVGLLAGGIAHDFNNILVGMFGNLELAKQKLLPNHPAYQYIQTANQAMDIASNLTNQLLTFAKGGDPLFEIVDVKQIVQDSIKFTLSGSNVKTIKILQKDLWLLNADKGQLSQVLTNILINAVQAMPRGGTLTIEASNIRETTTNLIPKLSGEFISLKISDEGVGISKEQQKYIFDPYFTTKQSGSGLGLATAHSIIAKHKGYISVESELGKGTTFSIYLPAKSDAQLVDEVLLNDTREPLEKSGNILVMDDQQLILDVLSQMLQSLGFIVETALDGDQAIEKYTEAHKSGRPFDAVIMDLTIPGGKGGEDVIKELLVINPEIKAIVSSGYSTSPIMSNYTEYGFKGRLVKPFQMKVLKNELFKLLNHPSS